MLSYSDSRNHRGHTVLSMRPTPSGQPEVRAILLPTRQIRIGRLRKPVGLYGSERLTIGDPHFSRCSLYHSMVSSSPSTSV